MSRLTVLALAWCAGLSLAAWQSPLLIPLLLVSLLGLTVLLWLGRRVRLEPWPILAAVLLGYGRLWLADWRPARDAWEPLFDREVAVIGMVDEDPLDPKGVVRVRLLVDSVAMDGQPQPLTPTWSPGDPRAPLCQALPWVCAPGAAEPPAWLPGWSPAIQVSVNADRLPYGEGERLLRYGTWLRLSGRLREAPEFDLFPYRQTLAREAVYARIPTVKDVQAVERVGGSPIRAGALGLRRQFDGLIRELLPGSPREAGLLAGILLGLQVRLTDEMVEALRRTSLSHIVVISGYNITILAVGIGVALKRMALALGWLAGLALRYRRFDLCERLVALQHLCLPRSPAYLLLHLAALGAYAVFAGLDPSPARAALMAGVYVLARHLGRPSTTLTALAVTAWGITLVMPWALLDIGFQLSFAAVLGLAVLQPILNAWLGARRLLPPFDSPRRHLPYLSHTRRDLVSGTLAATLMTTPILSYYFNQVSAIGLLANVLALPVQPAIMFGGLAAVLVEWLGHGVQVAQTAVLTGAGWPESLRTVVVSLLYGLHSGVLSLAHVLGSGVWVLLRYTVEVVLALAAAPWAAFDWRASGQRVLFMYSLLGVTGLSLAFALRLVRLRSLFLAPALPALPAPDPTPALAPPHAAPAPAAPQPPPRLAPAQPVVALAERPGPPLTRPRRPAPPDANPFRPHYRFGVPSLPVSRALLAPIGERPSRPAASVEAIAPLAGAPPLGDPVSAAVVAPPPDEAVARQAAGSLGTHPRRPFEAHEYPAWTRRLGWRYVVPFFALWALVGLSWPLAAGRPDGRLHLTLVPPGDTVVVRTPHGERLVIGGGSWTSDTMTVADEGQAPWDRRLAVVAATRLDRAYLEALDAVMDRHRVRAAIAPPLPRSAAGFVWTSQVETQGATAVTVGERLPMTVTVDGVSLEVVAYDEVEKATLYGVRWGEVRFLLGGGLRGPVPLAPSPAAVALVSRQARPELIAALARASRPALWVVQTAAAEPTEDSGEPDWMEPLPAVLADRPTTLTTDGRRLWLDREPR